MKAIALFNADQHDEAMLLIKELAAACPTTNLLGCCVIETYLHIQLGIKPFNGACHNEAADHFTTTVNSGAFSSKFMPQIHEDLTVLFSWDLESLCLTAHQKRCQAFLLAGKSDQALEAHKLMMDVIGESAKASCLHWSNSMFSLAHPALAELNDRIFGVESSGQDQEGYNTEPNFFHGMHQHSQPRPQQHSWHLKRLRLAMTRTPHSAPPPVPPVTDPTTFKSHL
ncbi:hypothetical protein BDR05DRAFT_1002859 [Suillus weaverae]|nr:hypothetical protein BDR05DRAFT_1002859 [Suillus weaverae]